MYIDEKYYNYESLRDADKPIIDGFDYALDAVSDGMADMIADDICGEAETEDTIAGRMKRELIDAVLTDVREILASTRLEIIASLIDGRETE